jgi:hypothetical protein
MFLMSQGAADDDGQLHTLGLLEELRRECSLHWNTSSELSRKIDDALRKLANPNLHDIANMSFRVELWDRHANQVRWVVAAAGSVTVAHGAFDAAVKNWPHERFALRQGIMLIREHIPKDAPCR